MNQHYLQLYADFIVKVGVNVQPRQNFIIRCPVTMPEFGHACVKAGYEAGAKNCIVRWEDDKLSRLHYEYAKEEDLAAMKPYELRSYLDYAEDPDGCCTLAIHAADPEALAGLDAAKINRVNLARRKFLKPWQEYTMNDRVQWCVAAVPAPSWAAKVFPGIPVEEAMEKLWGLPRFHRRPCQRLESPCGRRPPPPRPAERLEPGPYPHDQLQRHRPDRWPGR